jgi:hypothetical protein
MRHALEKVVLVGSAALIALSLVADFIVRQARS